MKTPVRESRQLIFARIFLSLGFNSASADEKIKNRTSEIQANNNHPI
ncbi:MAG: hypothetical protein HGA23_09430 [Bacteroidales bacterium]|nr:hypothetical protein [Bacteroidales bacterium]